MPASEVLSGENSRAALLGVGMPILSISMVTFIHWAVGVLVSPDNVETEQVTMYDCPTCGFDGMDVLILALIGCLGTV